MDGNYYTIIKDVTASAYQKLYQHVLHCENWVWYAKILTPDVLFPNELKKHHSLIVPFISLFLFSFLHLSHLYFILFYFILFCSVLFIVLCITVHYMASGLDYL